MLSVVTSCAQSGLSCHYKPRVGACDLHELANHLRSQHTAVLIAQINRAGVLCEGGAGLDSHIELSCDKKVGNPGGKQTQRLVGSHTILTTLTPDTG